MLPGFRNRSLCRNTQCTLKKKDALCIIQVFLPTFLHTVRKHQVQSRLVIFHVSTSYPMLP